MIGRIYFNMDLFATATENYQKALYYSILSHDTLEMASCYYFLGLAAMDDPNNASISTAIDFFKESASLYESKNSDVDYYVSMKISNYSALANAYIEAAKLTGKKAYADSCYYYYDKKVGDYYLAHGEYSNYVSDCYNYVEYLKFLKKYHAALDEMLRLEKYIKQESSPVNLKDYHSRLYEVYVLLGDYKKALEHFELYDKYKSLTINDSTLNSLKDAELRRSRMLNALKLEHTESLHAAEKLRMRIVNISLIGGVALLSLLILIVFRLLKIKHKSNAELSAKNELLAVQKAEIEMQSSQIQSSINYARRIQRALLTPKEVVTRIFPNNFVLYKPRDVVSGDFFWVGQFGDNKVCIVADCTGHGVPGGFMSMLGMTNLNFIVNQDISPEIILEKLRQSVISSLNQNEKGIVDPDSTILDGMDLAVFVVNEKLMTLTYAGANTPLIVIRNNELRILKPDKMPVGISLVMTPFKSVTMELQKGDCIYAFSDGFQDQFANGISEKFSSRRLRDLLLEIHQRPMNEQYELLNQTFEEWRGSIVNQTDDVVIMGVRI
jgi:serine phosphatase RsbU (regulator of sigma subunit)